MAKTNILFKYQEFILFVGLTLWFAIFYITDANVPEWRVYLTTMLILGANLLPTYIFVLKKASFNKNLTRQHYLLYWVICFFVLQPICTALCIRLAPQQYDYSLFITSAITAFTLEILLTINAYYQRRVKGAKWLKKIGLENSVLISLILIALVIAAMGTSSLNNPKYHNSERLLIGFEFSLEKIFNHFGFFLSFFFQFLFMYLCGYFFFIINSRYLVSKVLKQYGLLLYILSVLTIVVIFYPIVAQLLISLPINKTLGRDIFSKHAFEFENAFGVIGIMLVSLPVVLAMQWGKQNTHILSLEKEKSQTELDLLKQQLNPHFFFNTLNNLYGLSLQQSDKTSDSILRLSELMRYTIYKGQLDRVSLIQELNYIDDYIQLQQIRLKKPLSFNFEKHIVDEDLKIAPLLLIVLVENAFKHGIEPAENQAYLNLYLKSDHQKVYFSCKNSIEEENAAKVRGIGLDNLKKRLALLYPNKHHLEINADKKSYSVTLEITI